MTTKTRTRIQKYLVADASREARSCGLDGCPVGGWAETEQARRRLAEALPYNISVRDFVGVAYIEDATGRYRAAW